MKGRYGKYLFISIQFILYISFLTLDILGKNISLSNYIKFSLVLLCLLYVLIGGFKSYGRQQLFLSYALIFTVISDLLILLLDYYLYGVIIFIIAQQLHGIRISILSRTINISTIDGSTIHDNTITGKIIKEMIIRIIYQTIISFVIGLLLWKADITINSLLVASIFYFISILTNTIQSLKLALLSRNRRDNKLLAAGMLLFLLCDINVGLFNLSDFINLGAAYNKIYLISSILMWTFYAPSQVMLALSKDDV